MVFNAYFKRFILLVLCIGLVPVHVDAAWPLLPSFKSITRHVFSLLKNNTENINEYIGCSVNNNNGSYYVDNAGYHCYRAPLCENEIYCCIQSKEKIYNMDVTLSLNDEGRIVFIQGCKKASVQWDKLGCNNIIVGHCYKGVFVLGNNEIQYTIRSKKQINVIQMILSNGNLKAIIEGELTNNDTKATCNTDQKYLAQQDTMSQNKLKYCTKRMGPSMWSWVSNLYAKNYALLSANDNMVSIKKVFGGYKGILCADNKELEVSPHQFDLLNRYSEYIQGLLNFQNSSQQIKLPELSSEELRLVLDLLNVLPMKQKDMLAPYEFQELVILAQKLDFLGINLLDQSLVDVLIRKIRNNNIDVHEVITALTGVEEQHLPVVDMFLQKISTLIKEQLIPILPLEQKRILPHDSRVLDAIFSPDKSKIVTILTSSVPVLWDVKTDKEPFRLQHGGWITKVRFSPDSSKVVIAAKDRTAKIWNVRTGEVLILQHDADWVYDARFSPDGSQVVTASQDGTARIWDAQTGTEICRLQDGGYIVRARFNFNGSKVVTSSHGGTTRIWDAQNGQKIHEFDGFQGHFSPDGKRILVISKDKKHARVYTVDYGEQIGEFKHDAWLTYDKIPIKRAIFSPNGSQIMTVAKDHSVKIWDVTGKKTFSEYRHSEHVNHAKFSPNCLWVATTSQDCVLKIGSVHGGKPHILQHPSIISRMHFSPDGSRVITACGDGCARVWDVHTGAEQNELKHAKDAAVYNAAVHNAHFSSDGLQVVTASQDKTARIWGISDTHENMLAAIDKLTGSQTLELFFLTQELVSLKVIEKQVKLFAADNEQKVVAVKQQEDLSDQQNKEQKMTQEEQEQEKIRKKRLEYYQKLFKG